jgi:MoaA/NifB/PqqE/SkfB family radical SAM enzyme
MLSQPFQPSEILFIPTTRCNLRCGHCGVRRRRERLSPAAAVRFLAACRRFGIERVGFTGGEPFLEPVFLARVVRAAVRHGFLFSRLMTNGVWFTSRKSLETRLRLLHEAGFDGTFCVSVDAFHQQELRKVAAFVRAVVRIWNRPDAVEIAAVYGAREAETRRKLARLARLLGAKLQGVGRGRRTRRLPAALIARMNREQRSRLQTAGPSFAKASEDKSAAPTYLAAEMDDALRIRVVPVPLAPVGPAARWAHPWDGAWFRDDFCRGPGHVFVVEPDGVVKPCCGYANERPELALGSVRRDSPRALVRRARRDPLLATIFEQGLQPVRRALEAEGWRFPGRTTSHCFFCHYLLTAVPRPLLRRCLPRPGGAPGRIPVSLTGAWQG